MVKALQIYSYTVNLQNIDDVELYEYRVSHELFDLMKQMNCNCARGNSMSGVAFNKMLCSEFQNIIYCYNRLWDIETYDYVWFYSTCHLDLDNILYKIRQWLDLEYQILYNTRFNRRVKEQWIIENKKALKDILTKDTYLKYRIIPRYYLCKVIQDELYMESIHRSLRFYYVCGESDASALSEPIFIENDHAFSYRISCHLVKPIEDIGYALNVKVHTRIWEESSIITDKKNYLRADESTSCYILPKNEYNQQSPSNAFIKLSVIRGKEKKYNIESSSDKIYVRATSIDMEEVLKQDKIDKGVNQTCILVTKKNGWRSKIKRGAGLPERYEILNIVTDRLKPLEVRDPIPFLGQPKISGSKKIAQLEKDLKQLKVEIGENVDRSRKVNAKPYRSPNQYSKIKLIVASNSLEFCKLAEEYLVVILRLEKTSENTYRNDQNIDISMVFISNNFTRTIDKNETELEREKEIEQCFPVQSQETLCLSLIDALDYRQHDLVDEKDPKGVIRRVCCKQRVLTQFVDYSDGTRKAFHDILINSIKDLVAQGGFTEKNILKADVSTLLGIERIGTTSNESIICMSKITESNTVINIFGHGRWIFLEEMIFQLKSTLLKKIKINRKRSATSVCRNELHQWIVNKVNEVLQSTKGYIYIFIDSTLRNNGLWKYATNDHFKNIFELEEFDNQRVRVIRINYEAELPDYKILCENKRYNKESGVFKGKNHTYYLVSKRSDTDQVGVAYTKFDKPDQFFRQPGLIEINIQGTDDEKELDEIALYVQKLRGNSITFDGHTRVPLPLHYLKRLTEYVAPFLK